MSFYFTLNDSFSINIGTNLTISFRIFHQDTVHR